MGRRSRHRWNQKYRLKNIYIITPVWCFFRAKAPTSNRKLCIVIFNVVGPKAVFQISILDEECFIITIIIPLVPPSLTFFPSSCNIAQFFSMNNNRDHSVISERSNLRPPLYQLPFFLIFVYSFICWKILVEKYLLKNNSMPLKNSICVTTMLFYRATWLVFPILSTTVDYCSAVVDSTCKPFLLGVGVSHVLRDPRNLCA